jgi:hypothetical protein
VEKMLASKSHKRKYSDDINNIPSKTLTEGITSLTLVLKTRVIKGFKKVNYDISHYKKIKNRVFEKQASNLNDSVINSSNIKILVNEDAIDSLSDSLEKVKETKKEEPQVMLPAIDQHLKYGSPVLWLKRRSENPERIYLSNSAKREHKSITPLIKNIKEMPTKLKVYNKKLSQRSIINLKASNIENISPEGSPFHRQCSLLLCEKKQDNKKIRRFSNVINITKQSGGSDIDEVIVMTIF